MVNIFLTFFLLVISTEGAAAPEPISKNHIKKSSDGTMHFSISVTNQQDSRSNNSMNVCTNQTAKQSDTTTTKESVVLNKVSELWQENLKIQKQIQEHGSNFISTNKWYLLAGALACSYAYLAYTIMSGSNYLGDSNLWSSWHQEIPLEELLAIPQQQLTQDLIREIQRRYTEPGSIADIVKPLGIFMVKIDQEEEQIKWYQWAYSWISYLRLNKLVPVNQNRFGKIAERLQRLAYYKNLFKSWAADYQLQQAERMWYRCPENESPDLSQTAKLLQIETRLKILDYWQKQVRYGVPKPA